MLKCLIHWKQGPNLCFLWCCGSMTWASFGPGFLPRFQHAELWQMYTTLGVANRSRFERWEAHDLGQWEGKTSGTEKKQMTVMFAGNIRKHNNMVLSCSITSVPRVMCHGCQEINSFEGSPTSFTRGPWMMLKTQSIRRIGPWSCEMLRYNCDNETKMT